MKIYYLKKKKKWGLLYLRQGDEWWKKNKSNSIFIVEKEKDCLVRRCVGDCLDNVDNLLCGILTLKKEKKGLKLLEVN